MNTLFSVVFFLSCAVLLVLDPEGFLPAVLSGAGNAATLCLSLLASYAAWMGVMRLWEDSGVTRGVSKLLRPVVGRLFKVEQEETKRAIAMNLSANLLGVGGAATPYGIKAANLIEGEKNADYASSMLFVLSATSLQLIPTSVVAMRVSLGSACPSDVILPTLLATVLSTLLGAVFVRLFIPKGEKSAKKQASRSPFYQKKQGAGIE
ncbi:MAG: spore maturation protein A [Clostridia bacterium]|nr:spore maturation protein A [Clostridia bacterium]